MTTNTDGIGAADARVYVFDNGRPLTATVAPAATIDSAGLSFVDTLDHQAISVTNNGSIGGSAPRVGGLQISGGTGDVTYLGVGSVSNATGAGLAVSGAGGIHITADGAVTAGQADGSRDKRGRTDTPAGLSAVETGSGDIVIDGSGSVRAPDGRGIVADESAPKGRGSIAVSGTGDVAGMGVICPGVPNVAKAIAHGKTGCSGIRATIDSPRNASDIRVTRSGNISGTSTAINAITAGNGNIFIQTGAGARVTGASEFGIEAESRGTGRISVQTGVGGSLYSGGNGIFAVNRADAVPSASSIVVMSAGTIESGTFPGAHLNKKNPTGTLGAISAGYVGGAQSMDAPTVFGRLVIENNATIHAESGDGILGYNFGAGSIDITTTGHIDAQAGSAVATRATSGPTRLTLTAAQIISNGSTEAAIDARSQTGAIQASIDAKTTVTGFGDAVGAKFRGARTHLDNAGTIAGRVGIVGENLRIANTGLISGTQYGIDLTGGLNEIGGSGRIVSGINVTQTAIFQPALAGTPVGTPLLIDGPLRFAANAGYRIRLSPNAADRTEVTGVAAIDRATLQVNTGKNAPAPGTSYEILSASQGIQGRFGTISSDLAFLNPSLSYGQTITGLTVLYDYRLAGGSQNEQAVGSGLDAAAAHNAAAPIFASLRQVTAGQGAAVIDSLSGEGIAAAQNVAQRSTALFTSSIFDQTTLYGSASTGNTITLIAPQPGFSTLATDQTLAASAKAQPVAELADRPTSYTAPTFVAPNRTWRAWATGFGGVEDIQGSAAVGSAYQQNTIYGGALGVDYQLIPNYLFGVAVGGSDGDFSVPGRATSGSTVGGHIALYDLATIGAFYGASSTTFSYFINRTTRFVGGVGGLDNETERGTFDSHEFRSRLEFGRHFDRFGNVVTPFAALEIGELRSNGFGETTVTGPGLFRLNVQGQSASSVPAFVGARLQEEVVLGDGMVFKPTLQAAWVHEFAPYRSQIGLIADLPGSTFLVDGARPARNATQIKVGAELAIGARTSIFANFDGELSGVIQLYAGKGGVRITW